MNTYITYITLNITLAEMNLKEVEDYLQKALGEPSFIGVSEGETGRTLVVQYKDAESVLCKLYRLAHELQQDCITYRIQDGNVLEKGVVGDYAYAYAYNYNDFVVASTKLLGCSGVPLQPTQKQSKWNRRMMTHVGLRILAAEAAIEKQYRPL